MTLPAVGHCMGSGRVRMGICRYWGCEDVGAFVLRLVSCQSMLSSRGTSWDIANNQTQSFESCHGYAISSWPINLSFLVSAARWTFDHRNCPKSRQPALHLGFVSKVVAPGRIANTASMLRCSLHQLDTSVIDRQSSSFNALTSEIGTSDIARSIGR